MPIALTVNPGAAAKQGLVRVQLRTRGHELSANCERLSDVLKMELSKVLAADPNVVVRVKYIVGARPVSGWLVTSLLIS